MHDVPSKASTQLLKYVPMSGEHTVSFEQALWTVAQSIDWPESTVISRKRTSIANALLHTIITVHWAQTPPRAATADRSRQAAICDKPYYAYQGGVVMYDVA